MKRKTLTVKDIVDQAVSNAKSDIEFAKAEHNCPLDYDIYPYDREVEEINTDEFHAVGCVNYGGSEGIYGEIYFMGTWHDQLSDLKYRNNSPGRLSHRRTISHSAVFLSRFLRRMPSTL